MRNKLFATAKEVVSFFGFVVVLFLFVAAAGNGALSASTTPQISAGLQTSPSAKGDSGDSPEHFDSISRIEPATGHPVGWVERSETQQSNPKSEIQNLSSTSIGDPQLDKAAFAQKTKKLQIPFIANNGQVDDHVKFYAKTFGGTVFVTKDGEIVYALPKSENSGVRIQESESNPKSQIQPEGWVEPVCVQTRTGRQDETQQADSVETQCVASLMHSPNGISPLERGTQPLIPSREGNGVCNATPTLNDMKETHPRPLLVEWRTGIALKEEFVGARIKAIQGEDPSVTKVNYFKGNDPEKWKTNVSTYDYVNLGEIYKGIELRLKAYGDNVEKLFCVKSGANPEQIKISLSGIQPPESPLEKGARGLWVNEEGQLVAETELGPVKFTKPIAYQEIDGKRVEVAVEY